MVDNGRIKAGDDVAVLVAEYFCFLGRRAVGVNALLTNAQDTRRAQRAAARQKELADGIVLMVSSSTHSRSLAL